MPERILLIEDNPANLDLMSYLLGAFGYGVVTAADGPAGLAAARAGGFDLVLCDVQLPGIDGYEIARRLKADPDPAVRAVPLVAVTALAMVGDRDKVLAAGFDHYLTKPIDPEGFVARVAGFLPPGGRVRVGRQEPGSGERPAAVPVEPDRRRTILVVDDRPVQLDLARSILEPHGYAVRTATTVRGGFDLAAAGRFDLILSDVCIGDETGHDLLRAVRADPRLAGIPFVFLTSTRLTDRDRTDALAIGATRYLTRPIDPADLLAEIETCLLETAGGADRGDDSDRG